MDTKNLIAVIIVLVSFVVLVTLMIRMIRTSKITEDLREELKSGFKIPSGVLSSKEMRSRSSEEMRSSSIGKELKLKEQSKKEDFISSPVEFDKFMERENLAKAGIFSKMRIINQMAKDIISGKREIQFDLDKLSPEQKRKAQMLLANIQIDISRATNPIYDSTYQIIAELVILLEFLLVAGALLFSCFDF